MSKHDININLNISISVSSDGSVNVNSVSSSTENAGHSEPWYEENSRMDIIGQNGNDGLHYAEVEAESLDADQLRELAAPYKKNFVISKKELEALTKDEIIALGQGMLGVDIYKRQHKDDIIAEFWREYKARY